MSVIKESEEYGLTFLKFDKDHIPAVKSLYDTYLIPTYKQRLGITDENYDQLIEKAKEIEELLYPEITSSPHYQGLSIVAVDKQGKVVACQMSYLLTEAYFNEYFVDYYEALSAKTKPPG